MNNGFRLEKFEVYNWGTFKDQVWSLEVGSGTALLVGANGSGKSTLVDAFLTLLVPPQKRNYNQASGEKSKRGERNETSYVRGAFERKSSDGETSSEIRYLRDKNSYSVLLARFVEAKTKQIVTLASVFYWANNPRPEKFFVVASKALSISEDFAVQGEVSSLKKRLRNQGAEVYDEFSKYSRDIIKGFGLRSEKALDLFNQTVSIKSIESLNEFVRTHMLEKTDILEKINELRGQYQNLTKAHEAIERAEKQIDLLNPLLREADEHTAKREQINQTELLLEVVPLYFAKAQLDLRQTAIRDCQTEQTALKQQLEQTKQQLESDRNQKLELQIALQNDDVGRRLTELERDIAQKQKAIAEKQKKADQYESLLNRLGFAPSDNQIDFLGQRQHAIERLEALEPDIERIKREIIKGEIEKEKLNEKLNELRHEIESLKSRQSNIPITNLQIREQIAVGLGIQETHLPFAGELIRVRPDASPWEAAIERLLNPLGRQLLVSEALYHDVSDFVNRTKLRGHLVYLRTLPQRSKLGALEFEANLLIAKLEVKPDHPMQAWLKTELMTRWDYVCCDSIEQFRRERRALTISGQIKHNENRHEKDDSRVLGDRSRYVLGWSNLEKLKVLEAAFLDLTSDLSTTQSEIKNLELEGKNLEQRKYTLQQFIGFENFDQIDWHSEVKVLDDLELQKQKLEQDSNHLQTLKQQLEVCQTRILNLETVQQKLNQDLGRLETNLNDHQHKSRAHETVLKEHPFEIWQAFIPTIETELRQKTLTLETAGDLQYSLNDSLNKRANVYRGQASKLETEISLKMSKFRDSYPEDSSEFDSSLESIPEYRRLFERLERDDLPRHREEFKTFLNDKMTIAIKSFQRHLETQEEDILSSIAALNSSLQHIDYTPATYIKLEAKRNTDVEIQEFKNALRACTPDGGLQNQELRENSFARIRELIERFSSFENWTNKVTDVRQWRVFAAEERYRETGQQKNYYEGSSGKSGGQQAKLAYTILASAIAYQYQLEQGASSHKTFRFVVVDEAFSKLDESNASYALELFKQLELQLLVVTPKDKTHVVESFIQSCHFVTNNAEENDSRVYNLTQSEFETQKQRWANES